MVTDVRRDGVTVKIGDRSESIATRTVLWAAGVLASPLGKQIAADAGAESDRAGRVLVAPDMSVPGHPEIYVIGDLSNFTHQTGKPLPGVAQPAIQQGHYVAKAIRVRLKGQTIKPFRYFDKGNLAVIGRAKAVADLNFIGVSGFPAWLLWISIHLLYIVEFQNRVLIALQWAWLYITWGRSARLITGKNPLPLDL
jgi:NADH dehydrogenase